MTAIENTAEAKKAKINAALNLLRNLPRTEILPYLEKYPDYKELLGLD